MKSKKSNKKECTTCKYYTGECTHESNVGIRVKYRIENKFYIKTPKELNADGDCRNYGTK